jgi:hypothetical protein
MSDPLDNRRPQFRQMVLFAAGGIAVIAIAYFAAMRVLEYPWDMSRRTSNAVALGQIARAMQIYHDIHGRLPPAAVYSKEGKPLLSWRVLILPIIEQASLYEQFKLDEPWDSPHNIQLLQHMPSLYVPLGAESDAQIDHTNWHVFVGRGAAFEGREGLRLPKDFPDGPGNTLLVVDAGPLVPWSKPEDLEYDPTGPLPDLPSLYRDGFYAAFADGSIFFIKRTLTEKTLRALITRNGNDVIGPDWDNMLPDWARRNTDQPSSTPPDRGKR